MQARHSRPASATKLHQITIGRVCYSHGMSLSVPTTYREVGRGRNRARTMTEIKENAPRQIPRPLRKRSRST